MQKSQMKLGTAHGPFFLVASENGLCGLFWEEQDVAMADSKILRQAARELGEYLAGKRTVFSVPLDVDFGTPFQRRVWRELTRIPYGRTISYADLARRIRNPKAVRAVGSANGANPLSIIVPCHRVIASDGGLGGYGGGLKLKARLLELERREKGGDVGLPAQLRKRRAPG